MAPLRPHSARLERHREAIPPYPEPSIRNRRSAARIRRPSLARLDGVENDDLVRTDEVQRGAGPLIEHVAGEMLRAQQRDPAVERFALAIEFGEPGLRQLGLLGEAKPGEQTALPLDEMV